MVTGAADVAFLVPCRTCGAPLRLDLASGRAYCVYCRSDAGFADDVLERARRHLAAIAALEREAADAATEADYQRQRQNFGWGGLQPLLPLFIGLYVIVGMGVGVSSQFAIDPFLAKYIGEEAAGFVGAVVALSIWGALVALPLALRARRRRVALAPPAVTLGALGCPGCGASVPVVYGRAMACPFCEADLIASEAANLAEQSVARSLVAEQRAAAAVARAVADREGARESEQTVGATLTHQLLFIVFVIGLSIAIGFAKLLFHF